MKTRMGLFLLILLGSLPTFAQDKVELFGYFESTAMGAVIQGKFTPLVTNKLRVDLKSSLTDNITFAANFDYITYHGHKEWNILDFMASSIADSVPEDLKPIYVIPFSDRTFLDNAYLKLSLKAFDLTVGKQQISLGTGYVWNPTDVFNIKDPLDPTYEQPGHNALRVDVALGNNTTLTALASPDETLDDSGKMIQLKGRLLHFDFTLIAVETVWRFHDYTAFDFDRMTFVETPEKRQLLGGSLVGELLGMGVWTEYGYNWMETSRDFYELVVGGDYTFDFQTYIMVEYYRNSLGKTRFSDYDLNDWMRLYAQEQKAIFRDQIFALVQHPVSDFISAGLSSLISLTDGSFALVPTLNISLSSNTELTAYFNINFGEEGTGFGKNTGSGGLIRLRVYF
ncbi:MAG: hypothetical protein MUP70_14880 [Candidatus Aminicenantes bacterium]|nr:hypothetical protein [Candidatus Aminicenantes bacterium]